MACVISIIQLLSIIITALSTRYFLCSTRVVLPEPPKAGEVMTASYLQAVFDSMVKMSNLNKKACLLLTFAIALQAVAWLCTL